MLHNTVGGVLSVSEMRAEDALYLSSNNNNNCERSEPSGEFNGTDFLYIYVSGRTSCRKCSQCFYVYLNIRPMRYYTVQI